MTQKDKSDKPARHRLTKVTTRAGDKGKTKLATGRTITKYSQVVKAMGSIDELNSHIGVLLAQSNTPHNDAELKEIQQNLFNMGAVFAMEGHFNAPDPASLESSTQTMNTALPPLTEFVLPGGGAAAAQSHICRAVCRRAESEIWSYLAEFEALQAQGPQSKADDSPEAQAYTDAYTNILKTAQYVNRLSDYFFVLARSLTETTEEQWSGPS